jgi:hypothetical protein
MLDETTPTLEQAVSPTPENWLQKIIGSISDEEAFLKASEYGRMFRQADKPIENDE